MTAESFDDGRTDVPSGVAGPVELLFAFAITAFLLAIVKGQAWAGRVRGRSVPSWPRPCC